MNAPLLTFPLQPFRPRVHATLPEGWTKSSLLALVFGIAHQIGLNATDVLVLRRLALKTRAPDYGDPTRSPICYERQIDMAANIGLSASQWRKVEQKLERLHLIARETAANGHRGRISGSLGMENCAGLSLEPLIAKLGDLREIELRQIEMTERLALCRLEISKARREIRGLGNGLGDHPFLATLIEERSTWHSPRSYATVSRAEGHLEELAALVDKLRNIFQSAAKMIGAAITNERCHKQTTNESSPESCSMPDGPEDRREERLGAPDAGLDEKFIGCLTVARLRDLASEDLRFYIDHAPSEGGPRTISDIDRAVLLRLRDLAISPSTFEEAVTEMGWLRAMLSVIVVDRNRHHPTKPIRNCAGALRAFTKRFRSCELDLRASIFGIWAREGRLQRFGANPVAGPYHASCRSRR